MKRFLLVGDYNRNNGPCNVNRALIECADSSLLYLKSKTKIARLIEFIVLSFICDAFLVSGGVLSGRMKIVYLFNKKIFVLMHGCLRYENEINKQGNDVKIYYAEDKVLEKSYQIIAVSEKYSEWLKQRFPEYKHKITFVNNGIEIFRRPMVCKRKGEIAVSGGNRNIKNNEIICKAVEKLNDEGVLCHVIIYGRLYANSFDVNAFPHAKYAGQLDKEEYYAMLDYAELFVVNSELEPFGLVVGDAINCNCSLLMSESVGAASIMKTKNEDIILNPYDIDEICSKIKYLLNNSNRERLYNSIDIMDCGNKSAYEKIKNICLNDAKN